MLKNSFFEVPWRDLPVLTATPPGREPTAKEKAPSDEYRLGANTRKSRTLLHQFAADGTQHSKHTST
jgi:hypothetical protein